MSWSTKLFCFATGRALEGSGGRRGLKKGTERMGLRTYERVGLNRRGTVYSCFEKGCRKKGTRQSRKVLWVVFFCPVLQRNLKEWHERPRKYVRKCKWKATRVGSTATVVRNSVLIISLNTFWGCRVHIFSDNRSRNSSILMMEFEQVAKFVVLHLVTNNCCFILRVLMTRGRK